MPIQRSAGAEIRQLIDALDGGDETMRESAIARLALIGPRAVEHLLQEFPSATPTARVGLLRAMERLADPRTLALARGAMTDESAAAQVAASGVLRALLTSGTSSIARDAFDALVTAALDPNRAPELRLAAWDAIRDTPGSARDRVRQALAADADPHVRQYAGGASPATDPPDVWSEAAEGRLPAAAGALKTALAAHKATARLTELQKLVDHVRTREQQERDPAAREEWRAVRGALHQALAARNSRLALYDLRESLLATDRLPVAFLAAIEEIGDASCLDTIAAAYDASSRSGDTWLRQHLASAFRAIIHRESLTRRHAALKRTLARWPEATTELIGR